MVKTAIQINVSIPQEINEKIEKFIAENESTLRRMGLRSKAQVVGAILENGLLEYERIVNCTKSYVERKPV